MADIAQDEPKGNAEATAGKQRRVGRTIGFAAAGVVLLAAIGAAIYALVAFDRSQQVTAVLRDIAIIVLALTTIIIGLLLALLLFQLQSLVALLRNEIRPILESANQTARTVRGTTTFVSDAVVTPVVSAASFLTAVRQTIRVLAANPRKTRKGIKPARGSDQPHSELDMPDPTDIQAISRSSEGG